MVSQVQRQPRRRHLPAYWRDTVEGYLFILPVILGLLLWTFGPMLASLYLSFTDYPLLKSPTFVGLRNFRDMFTEDYLRVLHSLWVTLLYAAMALPLSLLGSLSAALLLNQRVPGIRFFRTAFYLPTIVPGIAMVFIWGWLLNPEFGLVNATLERMGLPPVGWLSEPETALPSLAVLTLWSIGPAMIIFLAGLQGISQELYDAGKIDGATEWRLFWNITIPMLSPTIFFNLVTGLIFTFQYFLPPFVLTQGGPLFSTYVYNLNLYEKAFKWLQMGLAAAMAWFLFAIILLLTLVLFRGSDAYVYYEVKQ
ncbi:MAG TPA: sugar ABC transporter permease [Caldilineaceae bacterium]|nr:sugar ABC transporter permease [Caldilineaceae bacterium]